MTYFGGGLLVGGVATLVRHSVQEWWGEECAEKFRCSKALNPYPRDPKDPVIKYLGLG